MSQFNCVISKALYSSDSLGLRVTDDRIFTFRAAQTILERFTQSLAHTRHTKVRSEFLLQTKLNHHRLSLPSSTLANSRERGGVVRYFLADTAVFSRSPWAGSGTCTPSTPCGPERRPRAAGAAGPRGAAGGGPAAPRAGTSARRAAAGRTSSTWRCTAQPGRGRPRGERRPEAFPAAAAPAHRPPRPRSRGASPRARWASASPPPGPRVRAGGGPGRGAPRGAKGAPGPRRPCGALPATAPRCDAPAGVPPAPRVPQERPG